MKPNAIVTIARYGPDARKAVIPSMSPTAPQMAAATGSVNQKLQPTAVVSIAAVYAPSA